MQHTPQSTPAICNREVKVKWSAIGKRRKSTTPRPATKLLQPLHACTDSCERHELTGNKLRLQVVAALRS
jgi:hypothetical protein